MQYTYLQTPIGRLILVGQGDTLHELLFPEGRMSRQPDSEWTYVENAFKQAKTELTQYFAGKRREFALPLAASGTPFQLSVLAELQKVPYGTTASYLDIATRLGNAKATRAVGAANGRNPIPIIIPCHRIVGSNGRLTGFGGGLPTKQALLDLETGASPW